MSLPPGFLDEIRTRTSLAQVAGRKVTWDARKSNPGKGDYWAPCPFHQEKTASFHLDDRKGYYYCFGCHAKGDALNFVQETENVGFMEAVEILAREAGMTLPARDPAQKERTDHRKILIDVMEQAVQFYRLQLKTSQAAAARDYLSGRGLPETTLERFEIGFAPDARTSLFQHLTGKGVAPAQIVEAGLAIQPDDGGTPFDRFRGRIMFPIRDSRNRAIAFGGRAMDPNARAKYLNSPETPLFDKGRSLYNFSPAREAAGKTGALIVAEGYMDAIALSQAGFEHVVAPLGTAITEEQLLLFWRVAPEPIIALDGDKAGLRAAMRLIDIALPLLSPGHSLRFALLPEGLDPDDLLKTQGPGAMQKILENARPMVDLLWQRETEGKVFDSPERRAALDTALKNVLGTIRDVSIRNHYFAAVKELRSALFSPKRSGGGRPQRGPSQGRGKALSATANTKASLLAQGMASDRSGDVLRESIILAICVTYPEVIPTFETALERLPLSNPVHNRLRDALLHHGAGSAAQTDPAELQQNLAEEIGAQELENLLSLRHVKISPTIRRKTEPETVRMAVAEELAKLEANRGSEMEITEAMHDMTGLVDEGLTWRLGQAAEARNRAQRSTLPEGGTDAEDHEAMSKFLQNLLDSEVWVKKKR